MYLVKHAAVGNAFQAVFVVRVFVGVCVCERQRARLHTYLCVFYVCVCVCVRVCVCVYNKESLIWTIHVCKHGAYLQIQQRNSILNFA